MIFPVFHLLYKQTQIYVYFHFMNMSMRKKCFFVTTSKAKRILSSLSVVLPRLTSLADKTTFRLWRATLKDWKLGLFVSLRCCSCGLNKETFDIYRINDFSLTILLKKHLNLTFNAIFSKQHWVLSQTKYLSFKSSQRAETFYSHTPIVDLGIGPLLGKGKEVLVKYGHMNN